MTTIPRRALRFAKRRMRLFRALHLDGFVFIHINKTGGSSIERALRLPFEHLTATEKIAQLGQPAWDRRLTFAVVRNPWDRVVSHYHYRIQTNQTGLGDMPIPFRRWVELVYVQRDSAYHDNPKMFMPQSTWIRHPDGQVLVKEVLRFETLAQDFGRISELIGRRVDLPHLKPSKRGKYSDYYDQATRETVRRWFREDIDLFGYSF